MIQLNASNIVASREKCIELLMCGVDPIAALWWNKTDEGDYEAGSWSGEEYDDCPAWTLEELRVMIGQKVYTGLIDIVYDINARDKKGKKGEITPEDTRFFANTPKNAKHFPSGAEAAITILLEMIDNSFVDVEFINSRLRRHYKVK